MIIVEGPDGSGKTHLAKRMAEEFGLEYTRYSGLSSTTGPDGPAIADWWDAEIGYNRLLNIYDRCFYISEVIYQLATPGRPLLVDGGRMVRGITRMWTFEPMLIFCLPPFETALANIGQKERLEGVDNAALEKIHWAYHSMFALWSNGLMDYTMAWDYTRDEDDRLFSMARDYIDRQEAA